jgi:hypothetical protein
MAKIWPVFKTIHHDLFNSFPPKAIAFTPNFNIYPPFYGSFYLFQRINTNSISPSGDGYKDSTMLHNNNTLKTDTTYQGVGLRSWGGYEREDIQTLCMTK